MAVLQDDKWLSGILGKPCFSLKWHNGDQLLEDLPDGFQYVKLPMDQACDLPHLTSGGFDVISVDVTLTMKPARHYQGDDSPGEIYRPARQSDSGHVEGIAARSFIFDRFHVDDKVPHECAEQIKKEWAGNFFKGLRGTHMFVAEVNANVAAFLQILLKDGELVIDLIGVAKEYQGRGIAAKLISRAIAELKPAKATVGTQLSNIASLKLYTSLGFQIEKSVFVLHRHSDGASS